MEDNVLKDSYRVSDLQDVICIDFLEQVTDAKSNVRRAELAVDDVYKILEAHPQEKFKILVDMSTMGESHIPLQAHKIYLSALKKDSITKVAVVGDFKTQLKVLSFLTPFIVGEGKKVTWFPNTVEAQLWLEK